MSDASDAPVTFEESLQQLQQIVRDLEDGALGLEPSLARFEQGIHLLRNCYTILERAEQRIEILTGFDAAGNPITAPFDATATMEIVEKPARKSTRRRSAAPESPEPVPEPELPAEPGDSLF